MATAPKAHAEFNPGVETKFDSNGKPIDGIGSFNLNSTGEEHSYTPIPRETVQYTGPYGKGTIIVNTAERRLYLVQGDGTALKYGIGVGRPGFAWSGVHSVTNKAEWPGWTPPPQMHRRRAEFAGLYAGWPR